MRAIKATIEFWKARHLLPGKRSRLCLASSLVVLSGCGCSSSHDVLAQHCPESPPARYRDGSGAPPKAVPAGSDSRIALVCPPGKAKGLGAISGDPS